jgi:hypothetical protein
MNASLHNVDVESVKVREFKSDETGAGFASVAVYDSNGNEVTLFFRDLTEVMFFSSRVMVARDEAQKARK